MITQEFIDKYGDSLTLDSEGIPTYSSLMSLPIVKNYIGEAKILDALNRNNKVLPNTVENVGILVNEADRMNKADKDHVAIVDYTEEGELTI